MQKKLKSSIIKSFKLLNKITKIMINLIYNMILTIKENKEIKIK